MYLQGAKLDILLFTAQTNNKLYSLNLCGCLFTHSDVNVSCLAFHKSNPLAKQIHKSMYVD